MEEEMHFVSTSLEQSVKVTENLTLSEANLREELMNVINSNTEEMNAMICSHNEIMKTTEEKLFQLEVQNRELKDKISQKAGSVKKQKKGIKNSVKVISDDEDSEIEIEDEDTIDVNKTHYGFIKNDMNMSRKSEGRANTVRLYDIFCFPLYAQSLCSVMTCRGNVDNSQDTVSSLNQNVVLPYIYTRAHTHKDIHIYTHTHTHKHTHKPIHTYTHTHT